MDMSRQALKDICKQHDLYRTPSLNDKLYCNFKGFRRISPALGDYTGLRALFLEGNALDSMEGIPELKELRCLYLQQNIIAEVTGLDALDNLDTLNLANNLITHLDNLSCCKNLRTLLVNHNLLSGVDSIQHVAKCVALQTLDLQHNKIEDPGVLDALQAIPDLRCLYLKGNPVVAKIKNYRKTVVSRISSLVYLDDRPVFEKERRTSEAWAKGGLEAEREERNRIRDEEAEKDRRNFEYMKKIREDGWRKRRERLGLPPGDTDPYFDDLSDTEYELRGEPEELRNARTELESYLQMKTVDAENVQGDADQQIYLESMKENQLELAQEFAAKLSSEMREKAACTSSSPKGLEPLPAPPGQQVVSVVSDDIEQGKD